VRSADERERPNALIQKGKAPVCQVLKARILLKADASEAGEAWSDSQIAEALDTSIDTIARARQQLVEGGIDALTRKQSSNSARKRIFDGAAEAKLIALACSDPPKGRVRWMLKLLESALGERNIVDRASDNTIGRTLKKDPQAAPPEAMSHPAGCQRRFRSRDGGRPGGLP
jgi:transposase